MKLLALPAVLAFLSMQTSPIPDVNLAVSFHERVEGEGLRKPLYVLEVHCLDGECSYSYVSLNDCGTAGPRLGAFFPKVEMVSVKNGDLKVTNEGAVLTLVQTGTDSYGNWVNTFRIGYEPTKDGSPATRVVSFFGDFVKTSELVKRPTRIEYIPLQGPFQRLDAECPIFAPGVDSK